MADKRKEYEVEINGLTHNVLLSPEDAERYGDAATPVATRAPRASKAAGADNKAAEPENK